MRRSNNGKHNQPAVAASTQPRMPSALGRYAVAIGCALVACGIRFLLTPVLGARDPWILFVPAAMFAAWYGGIAPGLLTLIFGLFLGDYFFVPPLYSVGPVTPEELVGMLVYVVAAFVAIAVTKNFHRATYLARELRKNSQNLEREAGVRREMEDKLRASEGRLRLILESAN